MIIITREELTAVNDVLEELRLKFTKIYYKIKGRTVELSSHGKTAKYNIVDFVYVPETIIEEWEQYHIDLMNEEIEENATSNGKR